MNHEWLETQRVEQELVGRLHFHSELLARLGRKVLHVVCDENPDLGHDSSCEDMPVVLILWAWQQ